MSLPKQFINVIGATLAVAVVIGGLLLLATPLFVQAQATTRAAGDVAAGNLAYAAQVEDLRAEAGRIDEIEAELAADRAQIPVENDLDDVFALVASAADEAGVTVVSATAGDPVPWTPASGAETASQVPAETDAAEETDAASADPAPADTTQVGADRLQVSFTIVVEAGDPLRAARFVDALTAGPRLVAVAQSALTASGDEPLLTVNATTFVAPEA
ncbi:hypothetical protein M4I32_09990 [Microbacterium sp. LRZ72]|uniref:hypothetical protein n=1 Tax=Microbacterium sp. LRZ72 TaxID=2942481 RepID=UPI0029AD54DE|nr:hypothetical protein [Microbacterium sp. LRZ72]MDX2377129.1 hypothetical protein [Microbacterium sp. LRZ72]